MGGGGFPIDILLFGMVAAFLVLRLRGILGRKTGFERPPQGEAGPDGALAPGLVSTAVTFAGEAGWAARVAGGRTPTPGPCSL